MKKRLAIAGVCLALLLGFSACGSSEESAADPGEYPKKTIQLIVPWDAGGDTDAINRIVAEGLEKELGQTIVVKNIAGGSGTIGSTEALNAKNDGYTLLAIHESVAMSHLTGQADFGYFDFEPVSLMASAYKTVATSPKSPWNSMEELIADAKKRPEEISFAASLGSITQLEPALIQSAADIKFNIVGFDGTAQRMKAVVGNDVDLATVSVAAGKDYIKDDRLKLLGYTGEERSKELPDLPTLKEQGIDVVSATNRGIAAPKGTPEEIIKKLSVALEKVANDETFQKKMEELGTDVNYKNTQEYMEFLKNDQVFMEEALKDSGLIE